MYIYSRQSISQPATTSWKMTAQWIQFIVAMAYGPIILFIIHHLHAYGDCSRPSVEDGQIQIDNSNTHNIANEKITIYSRVCVWRHYILPSYVPVLVTSEAWQIWSFHPKRPSSVFSFTSQRDETSEKKRGESRGTEGEEIKGAGRVTSIRSHIYQVEEGLSVSLSSLSLFPAFSRL